VRIDEVAVLVGGADAVGVAVGAQAGLAAVGDSDRFAEGADVRLDGLGIDAGKERVGVGADLHVGHADAGEDVRENRAAAPYMESMQNFMPDFAMRSRSAKALDGFEVGGQEVDFGNGRGLRGAGTGLPRYDSMAEIMEGLPEPPYQPLYLTPFHCAGLCEEVIMMPPAAPRSRTPKLRAGVGVMRWRA
jgi:hypothetical protein